ncbi:hypothetical protein ACFRCQ_21885 [Cytobacillus firmus]|uniref:hypothetical protein n=1 Tax=Cytobacillus firmus TaxID=1399 RepID=UPI0036952D04
MEEKRDINLGINLDIQVSNIFLTSDKEEAAKRMQEGWQLIYTPENEIFTGTNLSNIWVLGC